MSAPINERMATAEVVDIWPTPKPLPTGLLAVPAFKAAMLPRPFADWVSDIAERMQAPAEYIAVTAMVTAGAVLGRKIGIRPQQHTDWHEVPNLWGCVVGRPGVMKSPSVAAALKPINKLQADARRDHEGRMSEFEAGEVERELRDAARRAAMKERLKNNPNADTADLAGPAEAAPTMRRYVANDTSYQMLGELLRTNENGLLVHRDEMVSLLKSLDQEQNCEARGFYLTGWNGSESYTFDRIIRGADIHIPSVTISMIGSTQPGRIRDYVSAAVKGGAGDDGLIQRFQMLVWPDISADWKEVDREPDPYARSQAFNAFERLDRMSAADLGATIDVYDETRPYVRFDPEALVIFRDWRAGFEKRIRSGDLHPAIESHLSKYRKLIPALALVHHFAHGAVGSVGALSLLAALSWGEFLEAHAMRVYGAALDSRRDGAREIARHIKRGDLGSSFTAREVQQKDWSGLPDAQHVGDAIDLLEELGWLRVKSIPTGGRPSTVCTVNPKVIAR